jgi:glycosyltransferase involved in cell wall biosynthesis
VTVEQPGWTRADGPGISFARAPHCIGVSGYLRKCRQVYSTITRAVTQNDAVIMRGASVLSACLEFSFSQGRPFGVEVIGDPYDVFAPGCIEHPLRPALRWALTETLKRQCGKACAVAYVTNSFLQQRYPGSSTAFTTSYSSVELPEEVFVKAPRSFKFKSPANVLTIGSLEQMYKGFDVLIEAVAICRRGGTDVRLVIVGDGRYRQKLQQQVRDLALEDVIFFTGQLQDRRAVFELFDTADLFVLPSKTEGLPRALIEAMARAVPAVGTSVGGIPELLEATYLVPPGDAVSLAHKIIEVVRQPELMASMAASNLFAARKYSDSLLRPRRRAFLQSLSHTTQSWIQWLRKPTASVRELTRNQETTNAALR